MQKEFQYKSLTHTLEQLRNQVVDSLPYISDYIPSDTKNPEELFYFLKDITKYKNDPKGVELLQTVQTLMDRNGRGDCDCFSILVLTSCYYLNFSPQQVVLVGKNKKVPSHIYTMVYDKQRKKMCSMDLTNPKYDTERSYKFKQTLPFNMILRLEDNYYPAPLASKSKRKAKKAIKEAADIKRYQAKQDKKTSRTVENSNRVVSRQTNRTASGGERRRKKLTGLKVKSGRKDNKLLRVTGRGEIINARTNKRLDKIQQPSGGGGGSEAGYEEELPEGAYEEEQEYSEYELMPEEEGGGEEYYEEEEEEQLSGGIFDLVKGAFKGVVNEVKGKGNGAISKVKAKVTNATAPQIKALQKEKIELQAKLDKEKTNKLIFSLVGTAAGLTTGYFIGKKL